MPSQLNVPTTLTFTCVEARFYPPSPEYPSGHSEFFAVYSGGLATRCHVAISPSDADQLLAAMQGSSPPPPTQGPVQPAPAPTPPAPKVAAPETVWDGDPRTEGQDDPDPVSERRPTTTIDQALPLGKPVKLETLEEDIVPPVRARKASAPRTLSMDSHGNPVFDDEDSSSPLGEEEVRSL